MACGISSRYVRLADWLTGNGGCVARIDLTQHAVGHDSLHLSENVHDGERLAGVPLHCIMTREKALKSGIGQEITGSGIDLQSEHTLLAMFLLQERRKPNSFWKAYIDCLPKQFATVPYNFSDAELRHLKGSYVLKMLDIRRKSLVDEYTRLCTAVPDVQQFTLAEFIWGRQVVISRLFGFSANGKKMAGLVPVIDAASHKIPALARWSCSDTTGRFEVTALQNIKQGRELVISYGRKCNSRFLVNYGFVLENNADNLASVRVPEEGSEHAINEAAAGPALEFRLSHACDDSFRKLLAVLRSRVADQASVWRFPVKNYEKAPISVVTERAVLRRLILVCRTALGEFDGSLERDEALLKHGISDLNMRYIVIMRRGEKQVLHKIINMASVFHDLLSQPLRKTLDALDHKFTQGHPWRDYVEGVVLPLLLSPDAQSPPQSVPESTLQALAHINSR